MDSPEGRLPSAVPWLFSRQGLALLALATALAATFLATDVTFLAGALLVCGLGAHGWAAVALARVTYTRRTSRGRAFCGDDVILECTLANPRPLPLPWVEVWEQLPADLGPEGPLEASYAQPDRVWVRRGLALWPYQRLRWRRRLACRRRGVYRLGDARLRTGDPFGFFERERPWRDQLELLVYPRVVPLQRVALPLHHPSMDVVSPSSPVADPTRTATVRDYRPDDSRRMIHWATTARRGSLQVRVLEPATSLHVSLLMDVRGFSFGIYHGELLELTLSALASVAVYMQNEGAPIGLLANTDPPLVVPPGASVPHLQHVLEQLARLNAKAGLALMPWALDALPRRNTAVLAASELTPDLDRSIAQLENSGIHVLVLLATNQRRPNLGRRGTISISPGCDLSARLEGRA
ncbi:MAG: DUF58 domain-containing protein [Chloroflexota bacterium]|nr:DUF58 domain-containing protein [Chloroflexota bacterium]